MKIVIRSAYSPHVSCPLVFPDDEPSLTHQSFSAECDINNILARHAKTGILEHVNEHQGQYSDFCDVEDYQTSLNKVMAANDAFASLPAEIRARFVNNPAAFLEFVQDSNNLEEMYTMGLAIRPESVVAPTTPPSE